MIRRRHVLAFFVLSLLGLGAVGGTLLCCEASIPLPEPDITITSTGMPAEAGGAGEL